MGKKRKNKRIPTGTATQARKSTPPLDLDAAIRGTLHSDIDSEPKRYGDRVNVRGAVGEAAFLQTARRLPAWQQATIIDCDVLAEEAGGGSSKAGGVDFVVATPNGEVRWIQVKTLDENKTSNKKISDGYRSLVSPAKDSAKTMNWLLSDDCAALRALIKRTGGKEAPESLRRMLETGEQINILQQLTTHPPPSSSASLAPLKRKLDHLQTSLTNGIATQMVYPVPANHYQAVKQKTAATYLRMPYSSQAMSAATTRYLKRGLAKKQIETAPGTLRRSLSALPTVSDAQSRAKPQVEHDRAEHERLRARRLREINQLARVNNRHLIGSNMVDERRPHEEPINKPAKPPRVTRRRSMSDLDLR